MMQQTHQVKAERFSFTTSVLAVGVLLAVGCVVGFGMEGDSDVAGAISQAPPKKDYVALPQQWSYLFLGGLGLGSALAAVVYATKVKNTPYGLAQAVAGGGLASTLASVLTTKIIDTPWRWSDAAVFSGFWFIVGIVVWLVGLVLLVKCLVISPMKARFGPSQGIRAWVEFFEGFYSLRAWVSQAIVSLNSEKEWDDFACAAIDLHVEIDQDEWFALSEPSAELLQTIASERGKEPTLDQFMSVARAALMDPVQKLLAALSQCSMNFTVWAIDSKDDVLVHLASFPSPSGPVNGQRLRSPLAIWAKNGNSKAGSLAAKAMIERCYTVSGTDEPEFTSPTNHDGWERRALGTNYDFVGAMPIPCDGRTDPVWGVVCVEMREGTISLKTHAVQRVVALIARELDAAFRDFHAETRIQQRGLQGHTIVVIPLPDADRGEAPAPNGSENRKEGGPATK